MAKNPFNNNPIPDVDDEWENPCKVEVVDNDAETRIAIKENNATEAMISEMRKKVNQRNKSLSVLIDENKTNSSFNLSQALLELDGALIDSDILQRVKENIQTPKDLESYCKSVDSIYNRMQKQMLNSSDKDDTLNKVKESVRIMFGNGTVALGENDG